MDGNTAGVLILTMLMLTFFRYPPETRKGTDNAAANDCLLPPLNAWQIISKEFLKLLLFIPVEINSRFQVVQCCEKVFDPTLFLISKLEKDNQSKF